MKDDIKELKKSQANYSRAKEKYEEALKNLEAFKAIQEVEAQKIEEESSKDKESQKQNRIQKLSKQLTRKITENLQKTRTSGLEEKKQEEVGVSTKDSKASKKKKKKK